VVYRARDERLDRDVAIKVLPEEVARDPERLARFEREAKLLASLSHQNIAHLYGLETVERTVGEGFTPSRDSAPSGAESTPGPQAPRPSSPLTFLVMELAEGETLADRIERAPIPIDDALDWARQIAEGLEAAHENGIIHRDLKPANVMLSPEGAIKILDFGLAKAWYPESSDVDLNESPTLTAGMTRTGVMLGTAAYMSPEQARGKVVDKRTDVWAFGCVLFELLTRQRAFQGSDASQIAAAILRDEPDWAALPPGTPSHIRRLLGRCLVKSPRDRLHDIADARIELQPLSGDDRYRTEPATRATAPRGRSVWLPRLVVGIVGLALGALAAGFAFRFFETGMSPRPTARLDVFLPDDQHLDGHDSHILCLSPDGTRLVYVANGRLYLRQMDQTEPSPIRGTSGFARHARNPFFSPDGEYIGFWADGMLRKIHVNGGSSTPICEIPNPRGVSWGEDDTFLFGQGSGGIWKVSADGGPATQLIPVDAEAGEAAHGPQMLPNGSHVLFTLNTGRGWDSAQVVVQSLETGERQILVNGGADGRYVSTGHIVFLRGGTLFAAAFNSDDLEISGERVQVARNVRRAWNLASSGIGQFSISRSGTLAFSPFSPPSGVKNLVWVDRQGRATPLQTGNENFGYLSLSPDGNRVAVAITAGPTREIWIYDLAGNRPPFPIRRGGCSWDPVWTADGQRIIFSYADVQNSTEDLYWFSADGSDLEPELLHAQSGQQYPYAVSADGSDLFYAHFGSGEKRDEKRDVWVLDLKTQSDPKALFDSEYNEGFGTTSPDKRWIAHTSDRTGRQEVWVASYPDLLQRQLVSSDGGTEPRWSHDGRELYYRSGDRLMVVPIAVDTQEFSFEAPRVLFEGKMASNIGWPSYAVARDGRFLGMQLVDQPPEQPTSQRVRIVLNWFDELERLVPTD
jgi:serine/threonine-protein kinase